ncbi:MAG: hypothetical protein A3F16_04665 [Deltaproteobacteria bacterium RIFCSPHIGHO2_12_FULL_43_9]|nr:MAG: hypothetical protein A3F16_04665 [Deltaproteobacteria bacterium RIFCSPHIGHO2_12_FULL_43_9]
MSPLTADVSKRRVRILLTLLIIAFVAGILLGDRGLMRLFAIHRDTERVEETILKLSEEKMSLEEQIKQLEKGGIHLERYAREQLGLIAEDEIVYEFRKNKRVEK